MTSIKTLNSGSAVILLLCWYIFLTCFKVWAESAPNTKAPTAIEQYIHLQWQTFSNEPFPPIIDMAQDSQGTIWLATFKGVIKFDGVDFLQVFEDEHDNHLKGHTSAIAITADNTIWFVPVNKGLARISNGQLEHFTAKEGLLCDRIDRIALDKQGQLWYACAKGIAKFGHSQQTTHFKQQDQQVTALLIESDDEYWYGTNTGQLIRLKDNIETRWDHTHQLPQVNILSLHRNHNGELLFGIREHGIYQLKDGVIQRPEMFKPVEKAAVYRIFQATDNSYWLATFTGFVRVSHGKAEFVNLAADTAAQPRVFGVLQDNKGAIWAGTYGKGLHQLIPPKVNIMPNKSVRMVTEYQQAYWMGTDLGGVIIKPHQGKTRHLTTKDGLPSNTVHALFPDSKGNLWLGSSKGLVRYKNGEMQVFDLAPHGLSNWVTAITESQNGDIWVGTEKGLATVTNDKVVPEPDSDVIGKRRVRWIQQSSDKTLWVGTYDGVIYRQNEQWHNPEQPTLRHKAQRSFLQDRDGGLWFGSQQGEGLTWFREGVVKTFTTEDGLFDNYIWTIAEDHLGNLWLTSDKGINFVKRSLLENYNHQNPNNRIRSTTIGRYEGLDPAECNAASPGHWHTTANKLIFPCMAGLVEITPEKMMPSQNPPVNIIDYMLINNQKDWYPTDVVLQPNARDISIKYSGIGFDNPDKIQFKYRLQGYKNAWQHIGNRRFVSFTNLKAGGYTFEVTSRFYNGDWGKQPAQVHFTVKPFFHESTWFYLLIIIATVYFYQLFDKRRLNKVLQRQKEIDTARNEYLSALINNVAHNLNTPVGIAITGSSLLPGYHQRLSEMIETGKISKKALIELSDGLNQSSDLIGNSLTTVSSLIELFKKLNIDNYSESPQQIELMKLWQTIEQECVFDHPKRTIQWQIEHTAITINSYPQVISQILRILVDNTLKHGYPENKEATIALSCKQQKGQLTVHYQDFGIGLSKAQNQTLFIPFGNRIGDSKGLGLGMNIVYNLVTQKLQGQISSKRFDKPGVSFLITFAVD